VSGPEVSDYWTRESLWSTIHAWACRSKEAFACFLDGKSGKQCEALSETVRHLEDAIRHEDAEMLRRLVDKDPKASRVLGPGLLYAADMVDPYVKVDDFDPSYHDVHPSGALARADCRKCREGVEHWHRKTGNDPV